MIITILYIILFIIGVICLMLYKDPPKSFAKFCDKVDEKLNIDTRVSELMNDAIYKHDVEIKTSLSEKGINI